MAEPSSLPECPRCGAPAEPGRPACGRCGADLEPAADPVGPCDRCGAEREAGDPSCLACGRRFEPAACENHPERTAIADCVVCGRRLCDECDRSDGPAHLCAAHAGIPIIEGWAQVYATFDEVEAHLVRDNLHAEELDAEILSQQDHFAFPIHLGDLSPVRVLVPAFEYTAALRVIDAHRNRQGEVTFACPVCGELYGPFDARCARCGNPLR